MYQRAADLLMSVAMGKERTGSVSGDYFMCHSTSARRDRLPSVALRRRLSGGMEAGMAPDDGKAHTMTVYLVRHAEALHNVEEARAKEEVLSRLGTQEEAELAREHVLNNADFHDACLSKGGQHQVASAAQCFQTLLENTHCPMPELVLVSPLERALQTSQILFPEHAEVRALEFLREKRTGRPCDERSPACELAKRFPQVDFEDVEDVDGVSGDGYEFRDELKEDNAAVAERAARLLQVLHENECEAVAVVTHKAFLRALNMGPWADTLDLEERSLTAEFGNAEIRVCNIDWNSCGMPFVRMRSLTDAMWRPHMHVETRPMYNSPAFTSPQRATDESLRAAVGTSVDGQEDAVAAITAWRSMEEQLGGAPSFALIYCHSCVQPEEVTQALQAHTGAVAVIGGSSARGVLSGNGLSRVAVVGFSDLACAVQVASREGACGPNARQAAAEAAREAANGGRLRGGGWKRWLQGKPDLVFLSVAPGRESEVLAGIEDALGGVPVLGGSTSDEEPLGGCQAGRWWQLHGAAGGWGVHRDGIVVAALWLSPSARVRFNFLSCLAPTATGLRGHITKATGRTLEEIDDRPAAEVLNEWMGGALEHALQGGPVVRETALFPLALSPKHGGENETELRLVHAREILSAGCVECFTDISPGGVQLLCSRVSDLAGAAAAVARVALQKASAESTVKVAVVNICAAAVKFDEDQDQHLPDIQVFRDVLSEVLPCFFCYFTLGEIGMLNGRAQHCNFMVNITLFG